MADHRRIITVHTPLEQEVLDEVLSSVERALERVGSPRVWIDAEGRPDLVVMAELPAKPGQVELDAPGVPTWDDSECSQLIG